MPDQIVQYRYILEHRVLPQLLYSERGTDVIKTIIEHKGEFFVNAFDLIGMDAGVSCPYSAADYDFKLQLIRRSNASDIYILAVDMPQPEDTPLCSRIYICHDDHFGNIRYYTIEQSFDDVHMLCGWSDGVHNNYGVAPQTEEEQFRKVCSIYSDHLKDQGA